CLPPTKLDRSLDLFRIGEDCELAERDFAAFCDRHNAIGVRGDRMLNFATLQRTHAWPPAEGLDPFLSLGWSPQDIASIRNIPDPTKKINHRLRAATGRLVCTPAYLAAVGRMRSLWLALPFSVRPALPLARSIKLPQSIETTAESAPPELA